MVTRAIAVVMGVRLRRLRWSDRLGRRRRLRCVHVRMRLTRRLGLSALRRLGLDLLGVLRRLLGAGIVSGLGFSGMLCRLRLDLLIVLRLLLRTLIRPRLVPRLSVGLAGSGFGGALRLAGLNLLSVLQVLIFALLSLRLQTGILARLGIRLTAGGLGRSLCFLRLNLLRVLIRRDGVIVARRHGRYA